jgi:hypothetical protein
MGELLLKYSENDAKLAPKTSPAKTRSPAKNLMQQEQVNSRASPSPQRGTKRIRYTSHVTLPARLLICSVRKSQWTKRTRI